MNVRKEKKDVSMLVGVIENINITEEEIFENLKKSFEFTIVKSEDYYVVEYKEKEYPISIDKVENIGEYLSGFIGRNQYINPEDSEKLDNINEGIGIGMIYDEDLLTSFHLHLKLMSTAFPDLVAVLDMSGVAILNKYWVKMTSKSSVLPNPDYLVNIHGVGMKNNTGWYHTHGLQRCGYREIEIKHFPAEDSDLYYPLIDTVIKNLISDDKLENLQEKELFWVAHNYPCTLVGGNPVENDEFHGDNLDIKVYLSEEDYNSQVYSDITTLKEELQNNHRFFINDKETKRMSALAKERESYLLGILGKEGINILIKFGIETDNPSEYGRHEHLWFAIEKHENGTYTGKLLNEPYYVERLHEGDILEIEKEKITDWIICMEDSQITPDTVYLLEERKTFYN